MDYAWHDILGNIGVIFILGTYLALQLGRLTPERLVFSLVNGLGAALILISLSVEFNMSAFLVEAAWLVISIFGVVLYGLRLKNETREK